MTPSSNSSTATLEVSKHDWQRLEIALQSVKLTHSDRVQYPNSGLTKLQLAAYYVEVADDILPHIVGRPLSLVRCPEGVEGPKFFQKHAISAPDAIRQVPIPEERGTQDYLVVDNLAGLIALVQMAALEIHPWGSLADNIERPDRMIFDFDPDQTVAWEQVIAAAREVRDRLKKLNLESFAKTTGGKGLHVVVPIQRRYSWNEVKQFARSVADAMVADSPDRYTTSIRKASRAGRIYIDILRNTQGATAIAPFSTRANPSATVAAPLAWDELSADLHSDSIDVVGMAQRMRVLRKDPWAGFFKLKQSLCHAKPRE